MITVKVRTILTFKKILGRDTLEISLPEGSTLENLLMTMVRTWGDELASNWVTPYFSA